MDTFSSPFSSFTPPVRAQSELRSPRQDTVLTDPALSDYIIWLDKNGFTSEGETARRYAGRSALGLNCELNGPVGERNVYALHPRERILLVPETDRGLRVQIAAALATGNSVAVDAEPELSKALSDLPQSVSARVSWTANWETDGPFSGALIEGDAGCVNSVNRRSAALAGPLILVQAASSDELAHDPDAYCLNWLLEEISTSINTAVAGGNASLMSIG